MQPKKWKGFMLFLYVCRANGSVKIKNAVQKGSHLVLNIACYYSIFHIALPTGIKAREAFRIYIYLKLGLRKIKMNSVEPLSIIVF